MKGAPKDRGDYLEVTNNRIYFYSDVATKNVLGLNKTIKEHRKVDYDEQGIHDSIIYDFNILEPDMEFLGPAIVEDPSTTVVIFPGQKCKVDDYANLHISIDNGDI